MSEIRRYELDGVDCSAYCYGGSPKLVALTPEQTKWDDGELDLVRFPDHIAAVAAAVKQEQARMMKLIVARADKAGMDYKADPQAYHRGREDALDALADTLDGEER